MYNVFLKELNVKISKTYRLNEDVVKILDAQNNATLFLEDLVLNSRKISMGEAMILDRLNEIHGEGKGMFSGKNEGFATIGNQPQVFNVLTPKLTPSDIITDIKNLEAARDDELEWCQDSREIKRIKDEYQVKIDDAWKTYHSTKTQTSPPTA